MLGEAMVEFITSRDHRESLVTGSGLVDAGHVKEGLAGGEDSLRLQRPLPDEELVLSGTSS